MGQGKKKKKGVLGVMLCFYANIVVALVIYLTHGAAKEKVPAGFGIAMMCVAVLVMTAGWVAGIVNLVRTVRLVKEDDLKQLRRNMKILKFGTIPFFVLNFVYWFILGTLLALLLAIATRGALLITPLPIIYICVVGFCTYINMIITSISAIGYIIGLKRKGVINGNSVVLHVVFQLIFVTDVIDAIVLSVKYRKVNEVE